MADAGTGGAVPRRRPEHDPEVVGREADPGLLHPRPAPALPARRPRAAAARRAGGGRGGVRELVRATLEFEGYAAREAGGADEGLAAIEEAKPDLILLDVMMPQVDGWETLRQIQERWGAEAI